MSFLRQLRLSYAEPQHREFLAWCLPALLLGLLLRAVLMWQVPHGIYHMETADCLLTPERLFFDGQWEISGKETFLAPLLFCLPFLLHLPALLFIPIFQNLEGLAAILLVGLLCRLWFARWKLFILPLTFVAAADPFILWYERALMGETTFLFCTLLLALAGTLYNLRASRGRFAFLCAALVLEAAAHPQGILLFGSGLLLLCLLHGRLWPKLALLLALAVAMYFLTRTSETGLTFYTSVAQLTPTDLKTAPGFEPYLAPLRADLQSRWSPAPPFPKMHDRQMVAEAVERYLKESGSARSLPPGEGLNPFCSRLALETCRRNLLALPGVVYQKFRFTATGAPSNALDEESLFTRQHLAYAKTVSRPEMVSRALTGETLPSTEDFYHYVDRHYRSVPWFNHWARFWMIVANHFRCPDAIDSSHGAGQSSIYYGIPFYFLLAAIGVVLSMFRRGLLQPVAIAWGVGMAVLFFAILLTADAKPRARFVFEPFWFIYIAFLFDCLLLGLQTRTCRVIEPLPPDAVEPATP